MPWVVTLDTEAGVALQPSYDGIEISKIKIRLEGYERVDIMPLPTCISSYAPVFL